MQAKLTRWLPLLAALFSATAIAEQDYELPVEHRLERLTQELRLDADQRAKLDVIFKDQHEKFRLLHEQSHARMREVLLPEQLEKWEAMKKRHQATKDQHRPSSPPRY